MDDEARRDDASLEMAVEALLRYTVETCAGLYRTLGGSMTWEAFAARLQADFTAQLAEARRQAERPGPRPAPEEW